MEAVRDVKATFSAGDTRAKVIMPCGTGKTLVGLWIAEGLEMKSGRGVHTVVVFVPTHTLLRQVRSRGPEDRREC